MSAMGRSVKCWKWVSFWYSRSLSTWYLEKVKVSAAPESTSTWLWTVSSFGRWRCSCSQLYSFPKWCKALSFNAETKVRVCSSCNIPITASKSAPLSNSHCVHSAPVGWAAVCRAGKEVNTRDKKYIYRWVGTAEMVLSSYALILSQRCWADSLQQKTHLWNVRNFA